MFYSNNNNYMQDLYAYNQIPQNATYNPFMANSMPGAGNENMGFPNMNGMFMPNTMNSINTQNPSMFQGNQNMNNMNIQNPNNLYPSIYRIINPVVNRVVSGSNLPYLTEDNLNNMVDTVYNIVEGQVDLEEDMELSTQNEVGNIENRGTTTTTTTTNTNTTTQNPSLNTNTRTTTSTTPRNTINTSSTSNPTTNISSSSRRRNRNDSLLRDLIKILILRQIFSRNWMTQMPFNYQNNYQNQFAYNPNLMSF